MDSDRILKIVARISARTDALSVVDSAFESLNIYPPRMKEVSPNKYEGEIDTGWVMTVEEKGNRLICELNGKRMIDPLEAAKYYKTNKGKPSVTQNGPDRFVKDVYCLWGFDGEDGGEIERHFDVAIWDMPDGTHKIEVIQVKGPPINNPVLKGTFDSEWNATNDSDGKRDNFFNYIAANASMGGGNFPEENQIYEKI